MALITGCVVINGKVVDQLAVTDRALAYGDGLFETMPVTGGRIVLLDYHLARLTKGCHALGFCSQQIVLIADEIQRIVADMPSEPFILKLILSRGSGGRGYRPPIEAQYRRVFQCLPMVDYGVEQGGISVFQCQTRLPEAFALAGLKHLNRLPQVLAKQEWHDDAIAEGIMLDGQGYVVEGTQSNVFWLRNNTLYTSSLKRCGVAGVMRQLIIEKLAKKFNYDVVFEEIYYRQLYHVEAVFVCNSLMRICPVDCLLDTDKRLPIELNSSGHPVVAQLQHALIDIYPQ
ncbi:Aminodeoxychorismate lyase [Sinobacterium norvegicum]|uniref:Aminodeoxychorismate lyase n=1 Tax=Sinobacterium norvegicum TaxID=1641715 RepID=A0ABM9AAZ6_9GAMM|nr:aminodeoxychorismate lyase [Sinobacterium norvegicum]CAH0990126.1 Aminodeoxychorismate lyase [Sinobacterium norvegicum]